MFYGTVVTGERVSLSNFLCGHIHMPHRNGGILRASRQIETRATTEVRGDTKDGLGVRSNQPRRIIRLGLQQPLIQAANLSIVRTIGDNLIM